MNDSVQADLNSVLGEIRTEDLRLRREYVRELRFVWWGAWLLVGGMAYSCRRSRSRLPCGANCPHHSPRLRRANQSASRNWAGRWAVAGLGVLVAVGMLALGLGVRPELPAAVLSMPTQIADNGPAKGKDATQPTKPATNPSTQPLVDATDP